MGNRNRLGGPVHGGLVHGGLKAGLKKLVCCRGLTGESLRCGNRYLTRRQGRGRTVIDGVLKPNDTTAQLLVKLDSADDMDLLS